MKKIKTLLIAVTFLIIGLLTGCVMSKTDTTYASSDKIKLLDRIESAVTNNSNVGYISVYSYVDDETGIEYLIITNDKVEACGITVTTRLSNKSIYIPD